MAVPTNTRQVYTQPNIRENLINAVYNVAPFKTPFLSMSKRAGDVEQPYHEWNIDDLAAQNTANAAIEGDDATADAVAEPNRHGNYTQISRKTVSQSGTSQVVKAAGGTNKMGYQLMKRSKELKRDMEGILLLNQAKAAGAAGTARKLAGLPSWLGTNVVFRTGGGPSGANPATLDGAAARVYNSATGAVTEQNFKDVFQLQYTNSGDVAEYALMSAKNKQIASTFAGNGTRFGQVKDKKLATAVDVYESDFGDVKFIPDIFIPHSGDIFCVQPEYSKVGYLRPFQTINLAKTGDSDKKLLLVEYTYECGNEKAHGAIFDTTG